MTSKKIQPPFLKKGDEVGIVSPSFCIDENILYKSVKFLETWGLEVRIGKNAAKRKGPFAGSDEERLFDIQEMTNDPDIKAVICSRGGYGLSKIIDKIDFSSLIKNPKWYTGFSDVTVLHAWLNEVCGIISVHAEMPLNFNNSKKSADSFTSLKKALFGDILSYEWTGKIFNPANVAGEIIGGNLSLLYSLSGTRADLMTEGKLLFIEDVGENIYNIDRMLTSFKLSGKLRNLSAMIIGGMSKISDTKIPWSKDIEETIFDIVREYDYPVIFNFPAGHIPDNRALYIGKEAGIEIKEDKARLQYL